MSSTKFSFIVAVLFQLVANLAFAQETENELKLPEDLTIKEAKNYQLQELRVGGRLERVTVRRNGGLTEVYKNQRADTIWVSEQSDLGDIPNVRQWQIGSW